ncbi:MAG: hypothetical protein Q4C29_03710, partial [bacterium]|nr:hypothetical protein [bacterium]
FSTYPNKRYYDKYSYGTSYTEYTRGKLGDGSIEMSPSSNYSWYSDDAYFPSSSYSWFMRGGSYGNDSSAGLFYFGRGNGGVRSNGSARAVVFGALD